MSEVAQKDFGKAATSSKIKEFTPADCWLNNAKVVLEGADGEVIEAALSLGNVKIPLTKSDKATTDATKLRNALIEQAIAAGAEGKEITFKFTVRPADQHLPEAKLDTSSVKFA